MKNKVTLFFLFILLGHLAIAQDIVADGIKSIAEKYNAIGIAYAVVKKNKIIKTGAIGYKNLETKESLNSENLFRIASISKSFTATALMQLVENGEISLDDDFGDLVGFPVRNPAFPDQVITLRMVLSHTSSINDANGYFNLDVINPNKSLDWRKSYNSYSPGTQYEYCNLNFNMAGAVLERLTDKRFDQYIKQQILDPLNLDAGYCVDSLDSERFAYIYEYDRELEHFKIQSAAYNPRSEEISNYELGYSTPVFSPTGGMKISVTDLAKYMAMHLNYGKYAGKRILQKKSVKTMQTKVAHKEGYGLALCEVDNFIGNKKLIGHTGSAYGLYSSMFFSPEEKFGIVVITNGAVLKYDNGHVALTKEVSNFLYNSLIEKLREVPINKGGK
ncbi:beta-lactamase family protein [Sphingobacterium olei]|uniref:Beta-lactamase family protein n=1 Tax=Sphingobacterium olei TaxID=2571155 RepID=A0A4U0P8H6_9SPHI|nr:serine hydrolase domain-containing protein [Sphingobacterium olei]TJZ63102.1 beta-lactamase family protein [Sphingobacterium olei]